MGPAALTRYNQRVKVIAVAIVAALASCGPKPEPRDETMPSATLDKQDPTAHYEHHDSPTAGGGAWWRNFHPFSAPPDPFAGPTDPPHYYTGCGGCSSDDPSGALALLALIPAFARRRRMRCSTASSM